MLKLRDITKQMIARLEQRSGCHVHVMEDPKLDTLSKIKIARGNMPAHIISYKPGLKNESPDYSIIFQCAMALRVFDCAPDERRLIAASPTANESLQDILVRPNGIAEKFQLSGSDLDAFTGKLVDGLIAHLCSIPLSLRVSETISIDHPELLDLEVVHVERELLINKETLSAQIRELMPPQVFDPTQAISSAYVHFWAERLERPEIVNPYRLAGFESQGIELLKIYEGIPGDPANDCELIDAWAEYLGIRDWYTWLPYQAP